MRALPFSSIELQKPFGLPLSSYFAPPAFTSFHFLYDVLWLVPSSEVVLLFSFSSFGPLNRVGASAKKRKKKHRKFKEKEGEREREGKDFSWLFPILFYPCSSPSPPAHFHFQIMFLLFFPPYLPLLSTHPSRFTEGYVIKEEMALLFAHITHGI